MLVQTGGDRGEDLGQRPLGRVLDELRQGHTALVLVEFREAGDLRRRRLAQVARGEAHVECGEVEAEHAHLRQQPAERAVGDAPRARRSADQLEVVVELLRRAIAVRQFPQRAVEPCRDVGELAPKWLTLVAAPARDVGHLLLLARERQLQRGRDQQPLLCLRELCRERLDATAQQPQRGAAMQPQRRAHSLRRDDGVAVHVAAGPAAEAKRGAFGRPAGAEATRDLGLQARRGVEQHGLEEEQDPPHLVLDGRSQPAYRSGLPPQRERLAQLVFDHPPLGAPDALVVEPFHRRPDGLLVVEHRAPRRVGRMRGHHEPHVEPAERLVDLCVRAQRRRGARGGERLALRRARVGVVLSPAAQPLELLGDVRELQLHRAGSHVRLERGGAQARDEADETIARVVIAVAQLGRRLAQPKDAIAKRAAFLLLEHVAEERFEQRGVEVQGLHGEVAL